MNFNINKQTNSPEEYKQFREEVLNYIELNSAELRKYQRNYRNLLKTKVLNRKQANLRRSLYKNLELLRRERAELEARVKVATAPSNARETEWHMQLIKAHVHCQNKLLADIKCLWVEIRDLERQIIKVDKKIQKVRETTISDERYHKRLNRANNLLDMLQNQLEVNRKKEGKFFTYNKELRKTIVNLLTERALFNKFWRKAVNHLSSEKKYLVVLVEYSIDTLENSLGIYQRLEAIEKKANKETSIKKLEMQNTLRQIAAESLNQEFLKAKGKHREIADIEPREYKRREMFRKFHRNKLALYDKILKKVLSFTNSPTAMKAIESFQKKESLCYSYFNYTNELNYQITNLNNNINELYKEINNLKDVKLQNVDMNTEAIVDLRAELVREQAATRLKKNALAKVDGNLEALFSLLQRIFSILRCNDAPLMFFLGDHSKITPYNYFRFLKVIEERLNNVLAYVFVSQRKQERKAVREVGRDFDELSKVDNIVLAVQCAECAEGEEVNPYDKGFVHPLTKEEVKSTLRIKVVAPEIQYRLHNLIDCRLPRSRQLVQQASKK